MMLVEDPCMNIMITCRNPVRSTWIMQVSGWWIMHDKSFWQHIIAPEYVLDGEVSEANDIFSLGCLAYAIHNKGVALLQTFNNLRTYERKIQSLSTTSFNKMPVHLQGKSSSCCWLFFLLRMLSRQRLFAVFWPDTHHNALHQPSFRIQSTLTTFLYQPWSSWRVFLKRHVKKSPSLWKVYQEYWANSLNVYYGER